MPRKQPDLPPHMEPRKQWLSAFGAELVRLRPHLVGASKLMATHGVTALAKHGVDFDPVTAAREWHQAGSRTAVPSCNRA